MAPAIFQLSFNGTHNSAVRLHVCVCLCAWCNLFGWHGAAINLWNMSRRLRCGMDWRPMMANFEYCARVCGVCVRVCECVCLIVTNSVNQTNYHWQESLAHPCTHTDLYERAQNWFMGRGVMDARRTHSLQIANMSTVLRDRVSLIKLAHIYTEGKTTCLS